MSDPLYIAAKMALYQFRSHELFENKQRRAVFNETLANLQNAIEAYELINCPIPQKDQNTVRQPGSGEKWMTVGLDEWAGQ